MNRERLKILRDHLAGLPDERVNMTNFYTGKCGEDLPCKAANAEILHDCGTAACIAGWATFVFSVPRAEDAEYAAADALDLSRTQSDELFFPSLLWRRTRLDAIAAIDSMLANPDDNALPIWPEKAVAA